MSAIQPSRRGQRRTDARLTEFVHFVAAVLAVPDCEQAKGITPVSAGDMDAALAMAGAVRSHQAAAELLRAGKAEQSFWWDDSDTGLRCKCRPDWLNGATAVDLKTTTDASPAGFAKRRIYFEAG